MKFLILVALAGAEVFALGCGDGVDVVPIKGSFTFEEASEEPLLELSYEGGLIKDPDPTPFVRVFPNGRVLIHYPVYMKKAGDYELHLDDDELQQLLESFADQSMLDLDFNALNMIAAEAVAGPEELPDTHGVSTVVQIRAESFTPEGEDEATLEGVSTGLMVQDLAARTEVAPSSRLLQDFANGVRGLESLAERDDLLRLEPSEEGRDR